MKKSIRVVLGCLALLIGLGVLIVPGLAQNGQGYAPLLPAEVYQELVSRATKSIQENLAGKPEDHQLKKGQLEAVLIAAYTLSSKPADAGQAAALRHIALQLAAAAADESKLAEAKKLAAALAQPKTDPATKAAGPADVVKNAELLDLMNLLRPKAKKGDGLHPDLQLNARLKGTQNGIEELIRALAAKKVPDATLAKGSAELALLGYRMAVLGALTHDYGPEKKEGNSDPAVWKKLSVDMRDAGVALAQAAQKKDADAVLKAGTALNTSCTKCHDVFR